MTSLLFVLFFIVQASAILRQDVYGNTNLMTSGNLILEGAKVIVNDPIDLNGQVTASDIQASSIVFDAQSVANQNDALGRNNTPSFGSINLNGGTVFLGGVSNIDNLPNATGKPLSDSTDAAVLYTHSTGDVTDVRLLILDNDDDKFSIWGNSCGLGTCNNAADAAAVHVFQTNGDATHAGALSALSVAATNVVQTPLLTLTNNEAATCIGVSAGSLRFNDQKSVMELCAGGIWLTITQGLPRSCAHVKAMHPSAASGVFTVDPDGQGAIDVYCDMSSGYGWTLLMEVGGGDTMHVVNNGRAGAYPCLETTPGCKLSTIDINRFIAEPGTQVFREKAYNNPTLLPFYQRTSSDSDTWPPNLECTNRAALATPGSTWEWILASYPFLDDAVHGVNGDIGNYASSNHYYPTPFSSEQFFFSAGSGMRFNDAWDGASYSSGVRGGLWVTTTSTSSSKYRSCQHIRELLPRDSLADGWYDVDPDLSGSSLRVWCNFDGSRGWTLLMRITAAGTAHVSNNAAVGLPCAPTLGECRIATADITRFISAPGHQIFKVDPDDADRISWYQNAYDDSLVWPPNLECTQRDAGLAQADQSWIKTSYPTERDALQRTNGATGDYASANHYYPTPYSPYNIFFCVTTGMRVDTAWDTANTYESGRPGTYWIS